MSDNNLNWWKGLPDELQIDIECEQ